MEVSDIKYIISHCCISEINYPIIDENSLYPIKNNDKDSLTPFHHTLVRKRSCLIGKLLFIFRENN